MPDDTNFPPDDYDDPQFIEDEDWQPIPLESHPLFSNLPKRPVSPPPVQKPAPDPDQAAALADLQRFIEVTRPKRTSEPPTSETPPSTPTPAPITEKLPPLFKKAPSIELPPLPPEEPVVMIPEPLPAEPILEPETEGYSADDRMETLQVPGIQSPPPAPEIQSAFVNPALSRVTAGRIPRNSPQETSEVWLGLRTILVVVFAAFVVAFIFNYWTPDSFLSDDFVVNLQEVSSTQGPPTALPSPLPTFSSVRKIGIITGHSGPPLNPQFTEDPGAICDENFDGVPELRELDINTSVSYRVAALLVEAGYEVEMLNEWDPRLDNYRANTLISIHTNTCENLGFGATGFNVTGYERSPMIDRDNILVDCIVQTYTHYTGLPRHFGSPPDLVDYHAFRQVSVDTPTIIVELGFMFSDRTTLVNRPDDMAKAIYEGVICFLEPAKYTPPPTSPTLEPNAGG